MLNNQADKKAQVIDKIIKNLEDRLSPSSAGALMDFAQHYYAHVAYEDMLDGDPEDLYGALLAHWNFARQRIHGHSLVRVYNPSFDEHGWQSTHTVIEIVNDDMPFLVDSVIMELNRHGMRAHLIIHPVLQVIRNERGELQNIAIDQPETTAESFIHCEVDRKTDPTVLNQLEQDLIRILGDVRIAVEDWPMMCERMQHCAAELDTLDSILSAEEIAEYHAFLKWVEEKHFTFLGYRNYDLLTEDNKLILRSVSDSGLGILREQGGPRISPSFAELPVELQKLSAIPTPFILSKSRDHATVHRPAHMDYIGIKRFDDNNKVIGEHRFLGLYTAAAYNLTPRDIPLLRTKTRAILNRAGLVLESHAGRALQNILYTFPRDELFQASENELFNMVMGILNLQERQRLRIFVRKDIFARFVSCLVFVPRDRYDTVIRQRMQAILVEAFRGTSSTFATQFSESVLARVHFHIRTIPQELPEYSVPELEAKLRETLQSWEDELHKALLESYGEAQGNEMFQLYVEAFPAAYKEDFSARTAVSDIQRLESIKADTPLEMRLYRSLEDPDGLLYFKVFGPDKPMPLSDALPILERMGLRVLTAHPYEIHRPDASKRWLLNFDMQEDVGIRIDVNEVKHSFQEAFARIWNGQMENDGFNWLVLGAGLNWRDVVMLRAYCKYLLQTRVPFSQDYMQQTLTNHPRIVHQLVELFHARFDPAATVKRDIRMVTLITSIEEALEQVISLDEDRILRRFLAIIQATLRTNFFQTDQQGRHKDYLSFKFDPAKIPELPLPRPMFEISVYSPRVEAVHLRGGPAARGGLRWSDRREDFRTEVLGLMKAQMVKNSVIVPVGSKGGFVVKKPPVDGSREALQQEVQDCYRTFIRGMLDITDNRIGTKIVPPPLVVRYDNDDPYLVVAADKGTATFSDLANSIAIEYGFWLNDAFASGGSNGYDHKKMAITARGAWESVKRHFREMGRDIQNRDDFTVVGIGDMGGDVFGNGMLLSHHIKLLAAFNHLHIFLDPNPDPEISFQERERLFNMPRSSWADYKPELISKGGSVYSRTAKSISISPEVRSALGITEGQITPMDLINRLLKAPVDLLWNGGIGTYVKAQSESHADAGDRANDGVRVNGSELRCKVVGEGGNLGCTQLGRIEYALKGGCILTDAIDNSAGVNCSDHEVNIKILLNQVVSAGDMTEKQRNQLLADMTDEVAELVLRQNYLQPEAISITHSQAPDLLSTHIQAIRFLERNGKLNRALEFLPDDEKFAERETAGLGLTPPELAVLLAYIKITLFEELVASDVPEDAYLQRELIAYFPQPLRDRFVDQMNKHPLRREIIATYITNSMINRMGSGFLTRLRENSGETAPDIARAYSAARELYSARRLWQQIDELDNQISSATQIEMHLESRRLLERASLWLLRNRRPPLDIESSVRQFTSGVAELGSALPELLQPEERSIFEQNRQKFLEAGVPENLAHQVVSLPILYSALDLTEVALQADLPVNEVAKVYFALANRLNMNWLRHSIIELPVHNQWQSRARAALLDNLYDQGRLLTAAVLRLSPAEPSVEKRLNRWLENNRSVIERCLTLLADFQASGQQPDLAMLSVALREANNLVQGS